MTFNGHHREHVLNARKAHRKKHKYITGMGMHSHMTLEAAKRAEQHFHSNGYKDTKIRKNKDGTYRFMVLWPPK
jgi:hypothetical protein